MRIPSDIIARMDELIKDDELKQRIKNGDYDKNILLRSKCSKEVKDLIRKMLVNEHNKRITVECALDELMSLIG